MFQITYKKGFSITFENGWTVSVQFGPDNYCDNRGSQMTPQACGENGSANAETALLDPNDKFIKYKGKEIQTCRTPKEVLELLIFAEKKDKL